MTVGTNGDIICGVTYVYQEYLSECITTMGSAMTNHEFLMSTTSAISLE